MIILAIVKLDSVHQYEHYLTLRPLRYQTFKLREKDGGFGFGFSTGRLGSWRVLKEKPLLDSNVPQIKELMGQSLTKARFCGFKFNLERGTFAQFSK